MIRRTALAVALLLAVGAAPALAQEQSEEVVAAPACSDCHTEAETFVRNPHARGTLEDGVVPSALCASCHDGAFAHAESGGDPELVEVPRGFAGSNGTCLGCHDLSNHQDSRRNGIHANSNSVNCLTCHSIHHAEPTQPRLLVRRQLELCSSCHASYTAGFRNKPYAHRIGRGGMECSSCHNPHAALTGEPVRRSKSGTSACLDCHAEVRGPHVFPHAAREATIEGTDGCLNCHELHGSNNPKQLKRANVWQLCIECHSPITGDTLGSQPPAFHNLNLPRYRNCTTCHTAVHGSNRSPALLK